MTQLLIKTCPICASKRIRRVKRDIDAYHRRFPLRPGISKEELKNRLGLPLKVFNAAVAEWASANSRMNGRMMLLRSMKTADATRVSED